MGTAIRVLGCVSLTDGNSMLPVLAQVEVASGGLLIWGILSVLAGILILVVPRILNYIVAIYLIIIGALWIISAL